MSPTEYQELVEFLGHRFEQIDRRFDVIDQRFEQEYQGITQALRRLERPTS